MISAILLAAGQSKRMGQPKMLLPWGNVTVIEHVVTRFLQGGVKDILIVTGGARRQVEQALKPYPVRTVHNEEYQSGEMLSSLQCGLRALPTEALAALIGLGDQPQVQAETVRSVCEGYRASRAELVVPSYHRRRGHPWLVTRLLWEELLALQPPHSPRDFLNRHAADIQYVNVDTASILADLDTPEDYQHAHP